MSLQVIITIFLLLGLIVASDKVKFLAERTRKYQKAKEVYLTIAGIIAIGVLLWGIVANWDKIDFFQGRGGNPQRSYED